MNFIKFFSSSFILLFFLACGGEKAPASLFEIELDGGGNKFQQNQTVGISIKNKKNKTIDDVTYTLEGEELNVENGKIVLDASTLGDKTINATVKYEDQSVEVSKAIKVLAGKAPEIYTYTIINEFPHDKKAYTQGLEFYKDTLYESTGKKGRSSLRKVNWETGEPYQIVELEDTYFGEGITVLKDKIYMLTWRSGTGFTYDLALNRLDSFKYGQSKEGWGLTNDGKKLFKSDGTEKIWFLNPQTLVEEGNIETVTNKSINDSANELEFVNGKIYANVYQKPSVMIIDANSGAIEGVINFSGLGGKVTHHCTWSDTDNVLNGIAYHPTRKTFFVTGKEWDKMFEVTIEKK